MKRRAPILVMALLCLGAAPAVPVAYGQEAPDRAGTARAVDVPAFVSRSIVRIALIDLRLHPQPEPSDFRLASLLVELAQQLTPGDEDLVRWQVSLADAGDDADSLDRHLSKLLELAPRDTFAQYRLIATRLRREQRIEKRLAMYEQVLGPSGAALDASIRSRLAFDGATLCRERGDETGYVSKLKLAATLDPTNKEAAGAALRYFTGKTKDQMGRLELVANLLYADPTDPLTHLQIAREFYAGGDFESARRFQDNALAVYTRAHIDRGTPGLLEELSVDWPVDGPAKVVEKLNRALKIRRADADRLIEMAKADLQSTANMPKSEDIRLEPPLDRARLLAAKTAGDSQTADNAMADLRKWYDEVFLQLKATLPEAAKDIDPVAASRSLHLELATLLFWTDQTPELAAQDLEAGIAEPGTDPNDPDVLEARGWSLAHTDKAADAISMLSPIAETRPLSRLGIGAAHEQLGQKAEAAAQYGQVIREQPMTLEACWALGRLRELSGSQAPDPALARKMNTFALGVPGFIDDMTKEPRRAIALDAEVTANSLVATEPAVLRVTLSNITTVPLGVGPDRAIDSRVLVNPGLDVQLSTIREGVTPEILDMERRIRLMPRESLEVTFWSDPGLTGWLVENSCDQTVRVLWRLLQGFVRGPEGTIDVGPTSLSASTRTLIRSPLPEASLAPAELGARLAASSDAELPALVLAARSRLLATGPREKTPVQVSDLTSPAPLEPPPPALRAEDRALIAQGGAKRYEKSSPLARMLLLACLPHGRQVPEMKALDDLARADTDPAVTCLALVTRVSDAKDELLARGAASTDNRVSAVARLMSERLGAGSPCYGVLGPGLKGLVRQSEEGK